MADTSVLCATWNVHRAVGQDRRRDPGRIMDVIRDDIAPHRPDILALEEADEDCPPHSRVLDIARIETDTGLKSVHTDHKLRWGKTSDGFLGTILFVHPKWEVISADVLDLPGHCHRGAIAVHLAYGDQSVRVVATHLSLSQVFRIAQMRIIGQFLKRQPDMQTVVLGDLNEWRPWGGFALSPRLLGCALNGPALATFPTGRPLLPLDRILSDGPVKNAATLTSPLISVASDHRPLMANVTLVNR